MRPVHLAGVLGRVKGFNNGLVNVTLRLVIVDMGLNESAGAKSYDGSVKNLLRLVETLSDS